MAKQEALKAAASRMMGAPGELVKEARPPLSEKEQHQIVDTFIALIEGLYVHLPQKRSMYGRDPVQCLHLLQQKIGTIDEAHFHQGISEIITDLRDAHTRYIGPAHYQGRVAVLPLLIECYSDGRKIRYLASKISPVDSAQHQAFDDIGFEVGVEVTHWNGVPIHRAVDLYAERETGGRPDARQARALESLTIRPLRYALLPDEDWVIISFVKADSTKCDITVNWQYVELADDPESAELEDALRHVYAGNPAAETARRAKKLLFAHDAWYKADTGSLRSLADSVTKHKAKGEWFTGSFQDNVAARVITTKAGKFGLLRLWSFDLRDDDHFLDEVIDLVDQLPRNGLVIDLRGNPGGLIWAAERLLQLFTPETIDPTRFSLLATELTRAMAAAPQGEREFEPWRHNLNEAIVTGELYTRGMPLTPPVLCNDRGQNYPGPVVALVDANTYSSGDLFAAGFVDNRVGTLVSIGEASGAGGANVWFPQHVARALNGTGQSLPELPSGVSYTIAFRRAVRTGSLAGTSIEDLGIPGHYKRVLTHNDLMHNNSDLLEFCGSLLASERFTDMETEVEGDCLKVWTTGLDRADVFVEGRPLESKSIELGGTDQPIEFFVESDWTSIEIEGFSGAIVRQRRRLCP